MVNVYRLNHNNCIISFFLFFFFSFLEPRMINVNQKIDNNRINNMNENLEATKIRTDQEKVKYENSVVLSNFLCGFRTIFFLFFLVW